MLPFIPFAQDIQESLMTDACTITRNGSVVYDSIPCRVHHERLFTETPDPQDANTRSTFEWAWTMPAGTLVQVADVVTKDGSSISSIIGEVMLGGTWETAARAWGTSPKDAVQPTTITLMRYNSGTDEFDSVGSFVVTIHYDRNLPEETPARYSPTGSASYKGGTVAGTLSFTPQVGDRFNIGTNPIIPASIVYVLPNQPQRVEARFEAEISGHRL